MKALVTLNLLSPLLSHKLPNPSAKDCPDNQNNTLQQNTASCEWVNLPLFHFHCECMTMCPIPCDEMLLFASIKKSSGPLQKEPEGRNERTAEAKRNFFLSAGPTFRSPPMGPEGKMSKPLKRNGTFRSAHPLGPYNI